MASLHRSYHGNLVTLLQGKGISKVPMEHCNCSRPLRTTQSVGVGRYNGTSCSKDAFSRGPGQKVVSFALYGDRNSTHWKEKGYFEGIRGNLETMEKMLPEGIMRIYFDLEPGDLILDELCHLACQSQVLDLCHARKLPGTPMKDAHRVFPMMWRFFPTLDWQVDQCFSRDLDSRFSEREKTASNEWLQSNKSFHVIRDHPHHGVPMLGGMWACRFDLNPLVRKQWRQSWIKSKKDPILYVWRWAKNDSVQHDSYSCKQFPEARPFSTQRLTSPNNFVACVTSEGITLNITCPERCRPKEHQDWIYC
eukprot:TCALIF_09833-PA protein Name:"Protein of unknown function" AED:0.10 eAED:0.10 QI:0/0.33/0.25/1/0.33/0.25/4/193/306